jgi:hypothetical protein
MEDASGATWFQRNRKWAVPVGSLALLVLVGVAVVRVMNAGESKPAPIKPEAPASRVDRQAANEARMSQEVIALIGQPIVAGPREPAGASDLAFELPLSGPTGKGKLIVRARPPDAASATPEVFTFTELTFVPADKKAEPIHLVRPPP